MYAIDTLAFAKRLRTAGLDQEQAEAIAEAHGQAFREAAEHTLATKEDLAEVKSELKQDIAEVRSELKQDMKSLELRITTRLGGMLIAVTGIILAGIRLL